MDYSQSDFYGFRRIDFTFFNRHAFLVFPDCDYADGKWVMKAEYFGAFPSVELDLVKNGYCLAFIDNLNRWGDERDSDMKRSFADFLGAEFNFKKRFVQIGQSCGGLCAVNFAAKYPDYVSLLYLDAPVLNLLSCPLGLGDGEPLDGGKGWAELSAAYGGMTMSELICYRDHPIDKIDTLIKNGLPVALVYGGKDSLVPYHENGALLEKAYRQTRIPFYLYGKPECGHHPHGPVKPDGASDNESLIRFIVQNSL